MFPYVEAGGVVTLAGQLAQQPLVPGDVGRERARLQVVLEADRSLTLTLSADLGPVIARLVYFPQPFLFKARVGASCLKSSNRSTWWD